MQFHSSRKWKWKFKSVLVRERTPVNTCQWSKMVGGQSSSMSSVSKSETSQCSYCQRSFQNITERKMHEQQVRASATELTNKCLLKTNKHVFLKTKQAFSMCIRRFMSMCSNVVDVELSLLPREILPSTATSVHLNQVLIICNLSINYFLFSIRCRKLRGTWGQPAKEGKIWCSFENKEN